MKPHLRWAYPLFLSRVHIAVLVRLKALPWKPFNMSMPTALQEVLDLQLAVQMRDDHLAECQRQSEIDQQQIDELERQVLMQVCPLLPHARTDTPISIQSNMLL